MNQKWSIDTAHDIVNPQAGKCLDLTDGAFDRLGGVLNPDAGHIVVTQQVLN
ncbi:hypothetical protein ACIPC1_36795 [Streptomyces sp. NPDC087263]|uniref:hypothetical protein n=1 Tax=Streptomyces sp. NPDC087263 TaxID=3365773 RepID=UPI0037F5D76B